MLYVHERKRSEVFEPTLSAVGISISAALASYPKLRKDVQA